MFLQMEKKKKLLRAHGEDAVCVQSVCLNYSNTSGSQEVRARHRTHTTDRMQVQWNAAVMRCLDPSFGQHFKVILSFFYAMWKMCVFILLIWKTIFLFTFKNGFKALIEL